MHQFGTKEEMIAETLSRVLAPTRTRQDPASARRNTVARGISMEQDLFNLWTKVVDKPEGRAMVEILVAARTDKKLHNRVEPILKEYNNHINNEILRVYESISGNDENVIQLWTVCRIFMRSLHLQERFTSDPEATREIVKCFARLVSPHMRARTAQDDLE